jgi:Ser/Thr protein kinase RdoA (MazF antagonist)
MTPTSRPTLTDAVTHIEAFGVVAAARFGLRPAAPLELLSHRENAVFRVDDAVSGARYVLRIHRPGYQNQRSIRSELAWMEALSEAGVATPSALAGVDSDPIQAVTIDAIGVPFDCDVFHWIEGAPPGDADLAETYRMVGSINARMHCHVQAWSPPDGFERHVWDEGGMVGTDPLWGRFGDLTALSGEQRALLSEARNGVRERVIAFGKTPDLYGLIHSDLVPENILVTKDGPMVIDFDDCGFGWFLYDYASCVSRHEGGESFDTIHNAWVEGYRGVAPLSDDILDEALTFRLARQIVRLGWLHGRRDSLYAADYRHIAIAAACRLARQFLDK